MLALRSRRRYRPQRASARDPGRNTVAIRPALGRHRALEQRPARFAVGVSEFAGDRADCEQWPKCKNAPLDRALYLGRVEKVNDDGEVTARVWEYPSGHESLLILQLSDLQPSDPQDIERLAASGAAVVITAVPEWPWNQPRSALPQPQSKNDVLALRTSPDRSDRAKRNAVAVTLDHTGQITRLVLAGEADLYP